MRWEAWVLVAFHVVAMLAGIAAIGTERKPTTPQRAAAGTLLNLGFVLLVMRLGGAL